MELRDSRNKKTNKKSLKTCKLFSQILGGRLRKCLYCALEFHLFFMGIYEVGGILKKSSDYFQVDLWK